MFSLGVTGGIGSGKSTVCRMLEDLGAAVFDADRVARALMESDPELRNALKEAFGDDVYDASGRLNRTYVAARVFGDDAAIARLNALVHPRVYAAFEAAKERAAADGAVLLVLEAALIYESGGDQHLDAVAVVDAPLAKRLAWTSARDGVTPAQVEARMRHQLPPEELRARADYVIENEGSLEHLRSQVEHLFRSVTGSRA